MNKQQLKFKKVIKHRKRRIGKIIQLKESAVARIRKLYKK